MGWERRTRGSAAGYYYASVRTPSGVKKVYLGRGAAGHEAAAAAARKQADRLAADNLLVADRDQADRLAAELLAWADVLATVWLVLAGHHRHRGCWRRRHDG